MDIKIDSGEFDADAYRQGKMVTWESGQTSSASVDLTITYYLRNEFYPHQNQAVEIETSNSDGVITRITLSVEDFYNLLPPTLKERLKAHFVRDNTTGR